MECMSVIHPLVWPIGLLFNFSKEECESLTLNQAGQYIIFKRLYGSHVNGGKGGACFIQTLLNVNVDGKCKIWNKVAILNVKDDAMEYVCVNGENFLITALASLKCVLLRFNDHQPTHICVGRIRKRAS